jgi:hypothetical protein
MVHEPEKLKEARYFFQQMTASVNDPVAFQYELSAFLSSARSVLQYARKEARKKPGGQQSYDRQVTGNSVLEFFKDKRDVNVHAKPLRPTRHVSVSDTLNVMISESTRIEMRKEDGTVEVREFREERPELRPQEEATEVTSRHVFDDWNGPEDVIDLSRLYLAALDDFVKRGLADGIISG